MAWGEVKGGCASQADECQNNTAECDQGFAFGLGGIGGGGECQCQCGELCVVDGGGRGVCGIGGGESSTIE